MTVDKKINYEVQGGAKNYLGKQKEVTAPLKWKSSPNSPETELAYITKAEKDLLVKKDIHGSLKGDVNRGPSGIMSLDGYGSFDGPDPSKDTGMSGAATSAAESGKNTSDTLAEGASYQDVQDYQAASVAAGAGQRVNPGFFDSRFTVGPDVIKRAKAFAPQAFKKTQGGGIMDFFTGGGFLGNIVRGLGQKFGLGKRFDEPTYDMSRFSGLPLGGSTAFQNLDIRDKFDRRFQDTINQIPVVIDNDMSLVPDRGLTVAPGDGISTIPIGPMDTPQDQFKDDIFKDAMAEVTQKDIDASKARGFKMLDRDTAVTLGLISPNVTEYEFEQLKQGNITEPGTYTT